MGGGVGGGVDGRVDHLMVHIMDSLMVDGVLHHSLVIHIHIMGPLMVDGALQQSFLKVSLSLFLGRGVLRWISHVRNGIHYGHHFSGNVSIFFVEVLGIGREMSVKGRWGSWRQGRRGIGGSRARQRC